MKVLIVEDETNAASRLKNILTELDEQIEVLAICDSVKNTTLWLNSNPKPDLIFLDIQLSDGISFDIFKNVDVSCPIIFVTAFNEYTIDAFKVNSLDYILKPYVKNQIGDAIKKYHNVKNYNLTLVNKSIFDELSRAIRPNYKSRFYSKLNNQLYSITTDEILLFTFDHNATTLIDSTHRKFIINYSLDALEKRIDPSLFFRINRNFIVHINSIKRMNISRKSRITIIFDNDMKQDVSKAKTKDFKIWLDG